MIKLALTHDFVIAELKKIVTYFVVRFRQSPVKITPTVTEISRNNHSLEDRHVKN